MTRLRLIALSVGLSIICPFDICRADSPLSVRDAIEAVRPMSAYPSYVRGSDGSTRVAGLKNVWVSPDGRKYAVLLVHGDVEKNVNWMQIVSGSLASIEKARHPQIIASVYSSGLGAIDESGVNELTVPGRNLQPLAWLPDSQGIAFLWDDHKGTKQLFTVDVATHSVRQVTSHPTSVFSFGLGANGAVTFTAVVPTRESTPAEEGRGAVVLTDSLYSVLEGRYSEQEALHDYERLLVRPSQKGVMRIDLRLPWFPIYTSLAHDGRLAVVDAAPTSVPKIWRRYSTNFFKHAIAELRSGRLGFEARQVKQLFVLDMASGSTRPLWSALAAYNTNIVWSPDDKYLLLGPTYLPAEKAGIAGLAGEAVAVIEVATGKFEELTVPLGLARQGLQNFRWFGDHEIRFESAKRGLRFVRSDGSWRPASGGVQTAPPAGQPAVQVEWQQSLNSPPQLTAKEISTGRKVVLLNPNPRLGTDLALGKTERVHWTDNDKRVWNGLLYYPVSYVRGKVYPLVIQTHGYSPETEFSLYGAGNTAPGLGPSFSVYAAQPLANRQIAVLQVEDKSIDGVTGTPREPVMYMHAYEAAVAHFEKLGLVDSSRVGLVGFSRTVWHVEYALAHSAVAYVAAVVDDGWDGNYVQATSVFRQESQQDVGAPPFGEGLNTWLREAPAFNVEHVHAALRMQVSSGGLPGVLQMWEMYSRLRRLKRPVELFLLPDLEHGSHGIQNPRQCLEAKQGAVDWFDYWLNGHKRRDPATAEQYDRWDKMRNAPASAVSRE